MQTAREILGYFDEPDTEREQELTPQRRGPHIPGGWAVKEEIVCPAVANKKGRTRRPTGQIAAKVETNTAGTSLPPGVTPEQTHEPSSIPRAKTETAERSEPQVEGGASPDISHSGHAQPVPTDGNEDMEDQAEDDHPVSTHGSEETWGTNGRISKQHIR